MRYTAVLATFWNNPFLAEPDDLLFNPKVLKQMLQFAISRVCECGFPVVIEIAEDLHI